MFLKPYKVKSNIPLKGSEIKRLRQRIEETFPHKTGEELQCLLPQKCNVSLLKLITHKEPTNVYCVEKLPILFEIETERLVPTLYALWQCPDLLPYFTTVKDVLPRLSGGANLMLPGIVPLGTGMNMYGHYKKGQLIAVNLTSNKSAVGVGILPKSSDDLYMSGGRGSAVEMLHLFGDKLWGHEPSLTQQVPTHKPVNMTENDFPALGDELVKRKRAEDTKIVANNPPGGQPEHVQVDVESNISEMAALEISDNEVETKDAANPSETPEAMLKNAFLRALKNHGKSLQLPILTSIFYRQYVVPAAPEPIDIKKTKYKKLSNFLNEMVEQNFIVTREETKGVEKITSIDFAHPELINFIVDVTTSENLAGEDQPLFHSVLTELYIVTDATAPFFTKLDYKRGESIPATQVKKIVREYAQKHSLPTADALNKSLVLDDTLRGICKCTEATISQIASAVIAEMQHSYQMCTTMNASNKPLIQMSLATRSGNKKVTLVSNIECYGIIVPEFIKLCKQGAAASTTVIQLPNQKREQLQIQGNQVRFVHNLLTQTYKVPAKCILGLELAKDGKKHKKK